MALPWYTLLLFMSPSVRLSVEYPQDWRFHQTQKERDHQHRSGEEEPLVERRKEMLSVSFSLSLSIKESESAGFITIIVCLVGIIVSA